jgi:regulatory protein SWI6
MLASLRTTTTVPAQKSKDVISGMYSRILIVKHAHPYSEITTLISGLQQEFETEVKDKQEALEKGRIRLRTATRELADQRRQIQQWQVRCSELEETQQRIRNIQRATDEENKFDWSGRTEFDGSPAKAETVGAAFAHHGLESSMLSMELTDAVIDGAPEPEIPTENTPEALAKLRKIRAWYKRTDKILQDRLKALQGSSAERELRCQKIIALATGLNVAQVEQVSRSSTQLYIMAHLL